MSTEENKTLVRKFYAAFEGPDQDSLQTILAEDLVAYNPNPQNLQEHLAGIRGWNQIFSDNHFEILEQVAEGETVVSHVVMRCKHTKTAFQNIPPTGKMLEIGALSLERLRDGRIVERRVFSDRLGMLRQIGVIPS